jgi:hypothetical protein
MRGQRQRGSTKEREKDHEYDSEKNGRDNIN